jgi:hypothetical protein
MTLRNAPYDGAPVDRARPLCAKIRRACAKCGALPTRHILAVNVGSQTVSLYERVCASGACGPQTVANYRLVKTFRSSTSRFGVGEKAGSNQTPRGLHRIGEKCGGGWPVGTVFKGRKMVGYTWSGMPGAPITSRLFWLQGLEDGFNCGGSVDSWSRYIYIHGTGNETTLGKPDSIGCIHLSADDLIPLYDKLPTGTLVWIGE